MNILKFAFWPIFIIIIFIVFGITAVAVGKWQFEKQISSELENLKENNFKNYNEQIIKSEDLKHLPLPVQKWLNKVGIIGNRKIKAVKLKQSGLMKLEPEQQKYFKPEAEQYISVNEPGFLWQVNLKMMPLIKTKGRDYFYKGNASMLIKLAYLLSVVDQKSNSKINESALHRFLLELPWYPTAALNEYIKWEKIDSNSARAKINYQGIKAEADFIFDQAGNLLRTEAMRYKESSTDAERKKCRGELKEYKIVDGISIPSKIDVSWYLDSGKFTWFKVEVNEISFEY